MYLIFLAILYWIFCIFRSQRDVKGEREARLKEIEGLEELIR